MRRPFWAPALWCLPGSPHLVARPHRRQKYSRRPSFRRWPPPDRAENLGREVSINGEFHPYQEVELHAKVAAT